VHLFVADRRFDEWSAGLTEYERLPYEAVLPGHGQPGGKEIYGHDREYLAAAKRIVAEASSGEQLRGGPDRALPGLPRRAPTRRRRV
jgi:hypothetical protein